MRAFAILSFLVVAALGAFGVAAGRAQAQAFDACVDECVNESGCYGPSSEFDQGSDTCDTAQIDCEQRCKANTAGGARKRSFGAIALSYKSNDFGWTKDYTNRDAAENAALAFCANGPHHSQDCKTVIWFYNTCGALAEAPNGAAGWGYAKAAAQADAKALGKCESEGGNQQCTIRVTDCTP